MTKQFINYGSKAETETGFPNLSSPSNHEHLNLLEDITTLIHKMRTTKLPHLLIGLNILTFSDTASAQEQEEEKKENFHWDGFHLNGNLQTKLPYYLRAGLTYSGGTAPGAVHTAMFNFGQTFSIVKQLNLGYTLGLGVNKETLPTTEDKSLGIHSILELGRFRGSLAANLYGYDLGITFFPVLTTAFRGQATPVKTTHVDVFLGGEFSSINRNFQFGFTAGLRLKDIQLFDRNINGIFSITEMNTWKTTSTNDVIWAAYVEPRLGIVVDPESKQEKQDRVREYGQL